MQGCSETNTQGFPWGSLPGTSPGTHRRKAGFPSACPAPGVGRTAASGPSAESGSAFLDEACLSTVLPGPRFAALTAGLSEPLCAVLSCVLRLARELEQ